MANVLHLGGCMVREAEYRMNDSGKAFARFTMRVGGVSKNKEGKYESEFFNIVAFGKTAELVANYIHDKDFFNITCHLKNDKYTDKKTGEPRTGISIVMDRLEDFPPKASAKSSFDSMGAGEIDF